MDQQALGLPDDRRGRERHVEHELAAGSEVGARDAEHREMLLARGEVAQEVQRREHEREALRERQRAHVDSHELPAVRRGARLAQPPLGACQHRGRVVHPHRPAAVAHERGEHAAGAAAEFEDRPSDAPRQLPVERHVDGERVVLEVVVAGENHVGRLGSRQLGTHSPASDGRLVAPVAAAGEAVGALDQDEQPEQE